MNSTSLNKFKGDQLTKKLKELKVESLEVTKVVGALGAGTDMMATLQQRSNKAFEQGTSLQIEYAKVNSTTAAKIAIAKNNFEVLSITIGTKLLPALIPVIDKFVSIVNVVSAWADRNPGLVTALLILTATVAGLAFVISGVNFAIAAYRTAIVLVIAAQTTWNFLQGVMAVAMGTVNGTLLANKASMYGVMVATYAASAASSVVTAAQWLFNASLYGCPIVWIIAGIVALIAVVVIITKKWNSWGAAVSLFLGPLGLVISLFESFYRNWELIKKGFKTDGILGGLKAIGKTLLDAVLMPLQQILEIVGKIPGKLGAMARSGAANIEQFRKDLGVNVTSDDPQTTQTPAIAVNPKQSQQQAMVNTLQSVGGTVGGTIDINNNTNHDINTSNVTGPVKINTKSNVANWNNK